MTVAALGTAGAIAPAVGAVPPEACVDPDDLLPELEARNCAFTVDIEELA